MTAKIAHLVAGTVYLIIAVLFVTPLADSRSFFLLNMGGLQEASVINITQAVEVLGPRYAFGIFEDSNGLKWLDDNNFVNYFGCNHHKHRFNTLKAFTFLSVGFASFGLIVSLLGAGSGTPALGFASLAMGILTVIMSVIAMALGWDLWTQSYHCRGFSIKLGSHCEINYGPIFLTIGFFFSLFILAVLPALGALSTEVVKPKESEPVADMEEAEEKPESS